MTIVLLDIDNHNEVDAIIETNKLTAKKVQRLIDKMKREYEGCYDSEILTEILIENGCTINWVHDGEDEVYW